jgi:hypothetical protein
MVEDTAARPTPDEGDRGVEAKATAESARPVSDLVSEDSLTGSGISTVLRGIGSVAGQATLVAAFLFYFGWTRTQALMGYFGINAAISNLSVNDYILRSPNTTVRVLVILGLVALLLLSGHRVLVAALKTQHHLSVARIATWTGVCLGLLLLFAAVLGFYNWIIYSTKYPFVPIMFAAGMTLVGYGIHIRHIAGTGQRAKSWHAQTQMAMLIVLDIIFIFWAVAVYAGIAGQQSANELAANLKAQPSVVVYSENSLGLSASGVRVRQLEGSGLQYKYEYSNLKLLFYSHGQYFLVPANWRRGRDPVILLDAGVGIRFEFYNGS